jgi:flagellar biosynthetic protein FliR
METVSPFLVPFMLVLARVSAAVGVMPVFGWPGTPMRVRVGVALLVSFALAAVLPPAAPAGLQWVAVAVVLAGEIATGAAIGLVMALVFAGVQQSGVIIAQQMGLAVAAEIDPLTGEEEQPVGTFLETAFAIFFLAAGGHLVMLRLLARSYEALPPAAAPSAGLLTEAVIEAGAVMLVFALRLAAPLVAAFLVLAVILAVLARILPEMNVLLASLPIRVGLGLLLAASMLPILDAFSHELAQWLDVFLVT